MRWIRIIIALSLTFALGTSSYFGDLPLAIAAIGLVVALAYGWPLLTDSPQPVNTSLMLTVMGMVGMAIVWTSHEAPYLELLPIAAGVGLLWAFAQNLLRGIGASHAVANVSAQVAGLVVTLSAATWVAAMRMSGDKEAVIIGLVSIGLAQLATAVPWPARYTSPLAMVGSVLGGGVGSFVIKDGVLNVWWGMTLGAVMGLLVIAVDRMLGLVASSRFQAADIEHEPRRNKVRRLAVQVALGVAPLAIGGVVIYILERIFIYR